MEELTVTNGRDPSEMTGEERMAEVSMLLSMAMMRMWIKRRGQVQSAPMDKRAFSREGATIPLAPSRNNGSV